MNLFAKILVSISLVILNIVPVFAQQIGTVVPETRVDMVLDCQNLMTEIESSAFEIRKEVFNSRKNHVFPNLEGMPADGVSANDILGCGIKTGDIFLWMIPYYIRYILEFIIGLAGIIAIGGIIFGGYLYLFASISESKERGKLTIIYGLGGFIITLIAYAVVNIVLGFVTG